MIDVTELGATASTYCAVANGESGCCPNGETCTGGGGGGGGGGNNQECTTTGYVPCAGDDFCCRMCSHLPLVSLVVCSQPFFARIAAGYTCYRDSSNNPQCSLFSTGGTTITTSTTIRTSTSKAPGSTNVPNSDGNDNGDDGLPDNNGSNTLSPNSTSSTAQPSSTGLPNEALNGVADWKGSRSFLDLAPLLVLIGMSFGTTLSDGCTYRGKPSSLYSLVAPFDTTPDTTKSRYPVVTNAFNIYWYLLCFPCAKFYE